jgi:FkbM family methyltransferase
MKQMIKNTLRTLIGGMTRVVSNGPGWMRAAAAFAQSCIDNRRRITTGKGDIIIHVGSPIERWRADTLLTKEPETIAWLERTIVPEAVFYDVGANVGLYSLYAAHLFPGTVKAVCFEPEPMNFARLNQNILANGLSDQITAYPIGLGEAPDLTTFPLSVLQSGGALHGPRMVEDGKAAHVVGLNIWTLDAFRAQALQFPCPTHLKIDVDGPELEILRGAEATLHEPSLRHLLIELTGEELDEAVGIFSAAGFSQITQGQTQDGMFNLIFEKQS